MKASELKRGTVVSIEGRAYMVREVSVQSPSSRSGNTLYKVQYRDVVTRQKLEQSYRGDDDLPGILTFPRTGTIRYGRWKQIARDNLPQPTPDLDHVAGRFRAWAEGKFPMVHPDIEARFIGFCRGWAKE